MRQMGGHLYCRLDSFETALWMLVKSCSREQQQQELLLLPHVYPLPGPIILRNRLMYGSVVAAEREPKHWLAPGSLMWHCTVNAAQFRF